MDNKKPLLTLDEIEFQIQLIEKDIAEHTQKLFQAQGALSLIRDLARSYEWKRRKIAPSSPA